MTNHSSHLLTIKALLLLLNAKLRKHHSFITSGIVDACFRLVNIISNELVIHIMYFFGVAFYYGNNSMIICPSHIPYYVVVPCVYKGREVATCPYD